MAEPSLSDDEPDVSAPRVDDDGERPSIRVTDRRAAASMEQSGEDLIDSKAQGSVETPDADFEKRHRDVLNRLTRVQADFANYRRRSETEAQDIAKFANQALAFDVLRVVDGFERAFQALPTELRLLSWIDGIALTHAQLHGVLESQGVKPIECNPGDPVDTSIHEVVVSHDGDGPVVVAEELQRGYRIHDRVLRPALVKVGSADNVAVETESMPAGDPTVSDADSAKH